MRRRKSHQISGVVAGVDADSEGQHGHGEGQVAGRRVAQRDERQRRPPQTWQQTLITNKARRS